MANGNHLLAIERDGVNEGDPAYVQVPPVYEEREVRGGTGVKDVPREEGFVFGQPMTLKVEPKS